MAPRSMRRGLGVRAILSGGLLAIMAGVIPASAIDAPEFVESSIDSGWSPSANAVAVRFDKTLKAQSHCMTGNPAALIPGCTWTSAQVFNNDTNAVIAAAAADQNRGIDNNGAIISGNNIVWVAQSSLATNGTEYRIEISVLGAAPSSPQTASAWISDPFTVDAAPPIAPRITAPKALTTREIRIGGSAGAPELVHSYISVADPTQAPVVEFAGTAKDVTGIDGDTTATSGLAKVELQFYDALGILVHKQRFAVESVGAAESDWIVPAEEVTKADGSAALPAGLITMKVVAFDIAGGASAPSVPVQFVSVA